MRASARRPQGVIVAGAAVVLVVSGCTSTPGQDAVTSAARSFASALERGDGAAACRLLTIDADQSASGATDVPCETAISSVVEHGDSVHGVQVWGDAAQVRVGDDVLFLRRVSGAWRVSAAGCEPLPEGRYDCMVGS